MSHARLDIRVNTDCPDSWKVIRLCTRLGDGAFRCLIRLWCRVAQCRPDGELARLDERDIEALAGWTGEPGAFLAATIDAGLIDRVGDRSGDRSGYRIHGWTEHQPFVANRTGRQKASALANAAKRTKGGRKSFRTNTFSEPVTDSETGPVTDSASPSSPPMGEEKSADATAAPSGAPPCAAQDPIPKPAFAPRLRNAIVGPVRRAVS
jgi:hypothetical protein